MPSGPFLVIQLQAGAISVRKTELIKHSATCVVGHAQPEDRQHAEMGASANGFRVREFRRKRRFATQGIIPVTGWTTRTLDEKIVPASEHARLTKRENRPTTRKADSLPV